MKKTHPSELTISERKTWIIKLSVNRTKTHKKLETMLTRCLDTSSVWYSFDFKGHTIKMPTDSTMHKHKIKKYKKRSDYIEMNKMLIQVNEVG